MTITIIARLQRLERKMKIAIDDDCVIILDNIQCCPACAKKDLSPEEKTQVSRLHPVAIIDRVCPHWKEESLYAI